VVVVDPAQAVVGGEPLALDQADGGQLAGPLGVQGLGRFFLDKVVDLLLASAFHEAAVMAGWGPGRGGRNLGDACAPAGRADRGLFGAGKL
jgi:hypothetical protein